MGLYRARDILLPPSLLSLMRLPLALAFTLFVRQPAVAFALLIAAGATDVLDGYLARRFNLATPTGAAVDPVTDKLFVLTVVLTLVHGHQLHAADVILLSMREIGELPLVVWFGVSRRARKQRAEAPKANLVGKAATALQFGTIAAALFRVASLEWMLWATAAGGAFAAVSYWREALKTRAPAAPRAPARPRRCDA